LEKGVLTKK